MSTSRRRSPSPLRIKPEHWAPTPLPNWHGLLTPVVGRTFEELQVAVAVWISDDWWHPIQLARTLVAFEYEQGVANRRHAYNHRCFLEAGTKRQIVIGEHAGHFDIFVPLLDGEYLRGILVAGPIARKRPTSAQVQERWYQLMGTRARVTDPTFARYLAATLSTLTLEGRSFGVFQSLLDCFGQTLLGRGDVARLGDAANRHQKRLAVARLPERMWGSVREMLDAPSPEAWAIHAYGAMAAFGLQSFPEHVVVGLVLGQENESDPIDDRLRRDEFQRACTALAMSFGDVACGRVGDHGVVFLLNDPGSAGRVRNKLGDLSTRARALARRFGFVLHAGIAPKAASAPLRDRYQLALSAAEKALARGRALEWAEAHPQPTADPLRQLRSELGRSVGDLPTRLVPRFEQYIEAVLTHSGYRPEPTRAHLEAGLERLIEPLLASGLLDAKGHAEVYAACQRGAEDARTVQDLVATYRRVVLEVAAATKQPTFARQDRGTRRALDFIREHLEEPLSLARVARIAGFAPNYFSALLKRNEGVTFTRYVQNLRVERAKKMLVATTLGIEQVQRLSGFRSRAHFHRAFRAETHVAPNEYRKRSIASDAS